MISIKVNGGFLELLSKTSINLKLNNPIFADDNVIKDSYSLPFDIPITDNNVKILGHLDVLENTTTQKQFEAELYLDGVLYKSGLLKVSDAGIEQGTISSNFVFGLTTISNDIKELKIKDIIDHEIVLASSSYTKKLSVRAETSIGFPAPFTIIVNGQVYTESNNSDFATAINASTEEPRARATYHASGFLGGALDYFDVENFDDPNDIDAPLTVTIEQGTFYDSSLGYNLPNYWKWPIYADDFEAEYNDPIRDALNEYVTETPPNDIVRFPMVKNEAMYDDKTKYHLNLYHFAYQNAYLFPSEGYYLNKVSELDQGPRTVINPDNRTSISPFVYLTYIFDQIAIKLGTEFEGDFLTNSDIQSALLYHSNSLDKAIPFLGEKKYLATRRSFNVNEFVPDIKIADFLKELQKRFNLAIFYNETIKKIIIKFRDNYLDSSDYIDITNICSPVRRLGFISLSGLRLETALDSDDKAAPDDFYEEGEVEETIKTDFSGMNQQLIDDPEPQFTVRKHDLPVVFVPLSTQIPLRLLFYKGLIDDQVKADKNAANFDNTFDGVNGIKANIWRRWFRFVKDRKLATTDINFEIRHLLDIDWEKKYRIAGINYLFKSIDVTLTMQGIEPAKAELYST